MDNAVPRVRLRRDGKSRARTQPLHDMDKEA